LFRRFQGRLEGGREEGREGGRGERARGGRGEREKGGGKEETERIILKSLALKFYQLTGFFFFSGDCFGAGGLSAVTML
jgi:hypothetical protein